MGAEALQKVTAWLPSPLQVKFLTTAIESEGKPSISSLCEEAGVSRQTFYEWLKNDPDFKLKWEGLWQELLAGTFSTVVKSLVARAQGGDVAAVRLITELRGLTKPKGDSQSTINNQTNVYINLDFSKLSEDELRQYRSHLLAVRDVQSRIGIAPQGGGSGSGTL